jgi:hypothetical protein
MIDAAFSSNRVETVVITPELWRRRGWVPHSFPFRFLLLTSTMWVPHSPTPATKSSCWGPRSRAVFARGWGEIDVDYSEGCCFFSRVASGSAIFTTLDSR